MAGKTTYPTCFCILHLRLEDFEQPDPDRLIRLKQIPLEATVEKNHFNEADTFTVKLDMEDFPLDPRIVRGATVEIYMADAGALDENFWETQTLASPDFDINATVQEGTPSRYALMAGVVDNIRTGIGEDGRITELKGRDYTAFFLDVETEKNPVSFLAEDGKTPLTFLEVVQNVIDQRKEKTKAITIRAPETDAEGNPDDIEFLVPKDYKMRADDKETGSRRKKEGEVIWEVLQEIALEAGHVIYMDLDEIVIRKPRTIYFEDGMDETNWYHWTIGKDMKAFFPERKMGRQQGINVKAVSYLDDDKETLVSIRPPKDKVVEHAPPAASKVGGEPEEGGEGKRPVKNYRPFIFRGITSQTQLDEIADALYVLMQHHELEGKFETNEMVDSNGREFWRAGFGDPVVFDISESLRSVISLDQEAMVRRLLEKGYPEEDAAAIALTTHSAGVPFYFHSITHKFSSEEDGGYSMSAQIRSRRQVNLTGITTDVGANPTVFPGIP